MGEASEEQDRASVSSRRRMRTTAEKRAIVEETLVRGASVAAIARKHDVNANLLFGWRRLHKRGLLESCREPAAKLLTVEVATPTVLPSTMGQLVQAPTRTGTGSPPHREPGHIEITLPGGAVVHVVGLVDPALLQTVLSSLRLR
jgi:transposase